MAGSYRECDACGKRALRIANLCPGCGRELPSNPVPKGSGGLELDRFLTPKGVAIVLAVMAVLVSANRGRAGEPVKAKAEVESSMVRTAPSETATVAAPAERGSELRVAESWTDVRKSRSVSASIEAVLTPGDTVLADSLDQGWYRVALEGEVLGYAHRSTLVALGAGGE